MWLVILGIAIALAGVWVVRHEMRVKAALAKVEPTLDKVEAAARAEVAEVEKRV